MVEIISKKEFNEFMKAKGKVRAAGMKIYAEFIRKEKGEEGVKKLEEIITKLGYPIKYKEMRTLDFYPIGLETATLVAIQRLFNFDDKKFQEMGEFGTKLSFIIRLFMKYFISLEKMAKETARMWRKGGEVGELKVIECNRDERRVILRLENFSVHPLYCKVFRGYFITGIQMIMGEKGTCQETKCPFRGDKYHEFVLRW